MVMSLSSVYGESKVNLRSMSNNTDNEYSVTVRNRCTCSSFSLEILFSLADQLCHHGSIAIKKYPSICMATCGEWLRQEMLCLLHCLSPQNLIDFVLCH